LSIARISRSKKSVSALLECVKVTTGAWWFQQGGIGHSIKHKFQHGSWSKLAVSAWVDYTMAKIVQFSMECILTPKDGLTLDDLGSPEIAQFVYGEDDENTG
jgi:hypothetical protein